MFKFLEFIFLRKGHAHTLYLFIVFIFQLLYCFYIHLYIVDWLSCDLWLSCEWSTTMPIVTNNASAFRKCIYTLFSSLKKGSHLKHHRRGFLLNIWRADPVCRFFLLCCLLWFFIRHLELSVLRCAPLYTFLRNQNKTRIFFSCCELLQWKFGPEN